MGAVALAWMLAPTGCWVEYSVPAETDAVQTDTSQGDATTDPTASETETSCPPSAPRRCDGECVAVLDDREHCGDCGVACGLAEICDEGECVEPCDCESGVEFCEDGECFCREGLVRCDEECVDLRTDVDHCGECFETCDPGLVCMLEECVAECELEGDFEGCELVCSDQEIDPFNCGECGHVCEIDELCIFGVCRFFEPIDPRDCGSCPCDAVCGPLGEDLTCCFSRFTDTEVCVDTPVCPD